MRKFLLRGGRRQDEDLVDLTKGEDKQIHLRARDVYHLFVPFQCEPFYFHNLTNRDPSKSEAGIKLVVSIRRANLHVS